MIKHVTSCENCPFYVDLYSFCNLDVEINITYWEIKTIPEKCPLKQEELLVKINE